MAAYVVGPDPAGRGVPAELVPAIQKTAELVQEADHAVEAAVPIDEAHPGQHLRGDPVRSLDFLVHAASRAVDLQPAERENEQHHHAGEQQVDLEPQAHDRIPIGRC